MKDVIILNSFDRSGSSAVIKILSQNPSIEILFQPFNSGNIRSIMYEEMNEINAKKEDYLFFENMQKGSINTDYIKSEWFYKHSSTLVYKPNQLHVIKTTLNHLTIKWMKNHFPSINMWGIWRNPYDIGTSILRNDFFSSWYKKDVEKLIKTVNSSDEFNFFKDIINLLNDDIDYLFFMISFRSWYYFKFLKKENLINFHNFIEDLNLELNMFTNNYGLNKFDFVNKRDLNVIGKKYKKNESYRNLIKCKEKKIKLILEPLEVLMKEKYEITFN